MSSTHGKGVGGPLSQPLKGVVLAGGEDGGEVGVVDLGVVADLIGVHQRSDGTLNMVIGRVFPRDGHGRRPDGHHAQIPHLGGHCQGRRGGLDRG